MLHGFESLNPYLLLYQGASACEVFLPDSIGLLAMSIFIIK